MSTRAQAVVFREVKDGNHDWEWEDGAAYAASGGKARYVVVDGATEAFDPISWANRIVETFVAKAQGWPMEMTEHAFGVWFDHLQQSWTAENPAPQDSDDVFARLKAKDGSFATMLCCQIDGLGSATPTVTAAALGDTVLFHVRAGVRLSHFPAMEPSDFGRTPDGLFTAPGELPRMRAALRFTDPWPLAVGDRIYIATDAFAAWLLQIGPEIWAPLAAIDHPDVFRRLVSDRRATGELVNDDVTLLRIVITADPPDFVKVSR